MPVIEADITRIETGCLVQIKRDFVGNKLVFRSKETGTKDTEAERDAVHFSKTNNVKIIYHFNMDHFLVTPSGEMYPLGECKQWDSNMDLADSSDTLLPKEIL